MLLNSFMILLITIGRCETRSISFVVNHEEFFAVEEVNDRGHISLSETHERLLNLSDTISNTDKNQDSGLSDSKGVSSNNVHENVVDTNIDKNEEDDDNSVRDDINEDADDDDIHSSTLENFHDFDQHDKYDDVTGSEYDVESVSGLKKIFRKRRSAREQWRTSLPGAKPEKSAEDKEPEIWDEVSDAELERAQINTYKEAAKYAGWTLLSVLFFVFVGICFLRDPVACIFAFGTGCPCCLICCPCIRAFTDKYLDSKKIMRTQMNKYMPGIIVNDDGTLDHYDPTPDELDALAELIEEFSD